MQPEQNMPEPLHVHLHASGLILVISSTAMCMCNVVCAAAGEHVNNQGPEATSEPKANSLFCLPWPHHYV